MPFDADTKLKGHMSEIKAQLHYLETGWEVFTPLTNTSRADFVIINKTSGECKKVQVKTVQDNIVDGVTYRQCRLVPTGGTYQEHEVNLFFFVHLQTGDMWEAIWEDVVHLTSINVGRADGLGKKPKNSDILNRVSEVQH